MSKHASTIDTHLEAYGEPDAERRDELIAAIWTSDGALIDPPIEGAGHAGISDAATTPQSQFPGHTFRRTTDVDVHHDIARYEWELVAPNGDIAVAGLDVADFDAGGRLARIVGFLGPIPART